MKRYLLAAVASVMLVGFVVADEFSLNITLIDADGSVTGEKPATKSKGVFTDKQKVTVKLASDVRVHMGKRDPETGRFVAVGDDMKLAGLKAALPRALNGGALVDGKAIGEKDKLELSMRDDKPAVKLNGKEIPFATVKFRRAGPLTTKVTTSFDGVATTILIIPPGAGIVSFFDRWEKKADK